LVLCGIRWDCEDFIGVCARLGDAMTAFGIRQQAVDEFGCVILQQVVAILQYADY
jgi:hypothetical protein